MAYVTSMNVVTRVGSDAALQLTTDSGDIIDAGMITGLIDDVEAMVHGYVGKRMDTPVDQSAYPQMYNAVAGFVLDVTVYRLASRRPPVPDAWKTAYENAVKWLERFAKGEIDIPDSAANKPRIAHESSPSTGLGGEDGIRHW